MAFNDFMEESELFELLGKKNGCMAVTKRPWFFRILFLPTHRATAAKL